MRLLERLERVLSLSACAGNAFEEREARDDVSFVFSSVFHS
jgi:hypothetical protein